MHNEAKNQSHLSVGDVILIYICDCECIVFTGVVHRSSMSDFLLDPIDIERENHVGFVQNESDDAIDPAILDLLQQWNIGGDTENPFDALLPEEEEDLMASWNDNGWDPPTPPDPSTHLLQEALFHGDVMDHFEEEDPFLYLSSGTPTAAKEGDPPENDFSSCYYCQPCNDPLATVPWFLNDDEDNADDSYDGHLKDLFELQQEEDAFWQQQPFYKNEDDDLEPIPLVAPSSTDLHALAGETEEAPSIEPWDAATLAQALPYVAAFAHSVFPVEPEASALSQLELARDEYQARVQAAWEETQEHGPPREGYGHTERILGCALSHDGRYLATASQDATVRVWTVATHRLWHTLPSRQDYECLRVAWTHTSQWGGRVHQDTERYLLATGGADGNVCIWGCADPGAGNSSAWTLHSQLDHSLWHAQKKKNASTAATNTSTELGTIAEDEAEGHVHDGVVEVDETPQIYSLQFISHWAALSTNSGFLLTSSDDYVHIWEWITSEEEDENSPKKRKGDAPNDGAVVDEKEAQDSVMLFEEILSLHFTCLDHAGYGVRVGSLTTAPNVQSNFGGARNPHNLVYVFDAAYCAANGILGVALSDGTLRLMNGRGVCLSVLQLPPASVERVSTHLTSFAWDRTGQRLATTVATGHLVTWNLEVSNPLGVVVDPPGGNPLHRLVSEGIHTTCCAVMDGGHAFAKPLYGCTFLGEDDALLLSYGSDGRLCLWDSRRVGEVHAPLAILWDNPSPPPARKGGEGRGEGYPIYAMAVTSPTKCSVHETIAEGGSTTTTQLYQSTVVIAGGGMAAGGLLGTPVYLQDVYFLEPNDTEETNQNPSLQSATTEPP
jgi:WD40 repeat protein